MGAITLANMSNAWLSLKVNMGSFLRPKKHKSSETSKHQGLKDICNSNNTVLLIKVSCLKRQMKKNTDVCVYILLRILEVTPQLLKTIRVKNKWLSGESLGKCGGRFLNCFPCIFLSLLGIYFCVHVLLLYFC